MSSLPSPTAPSSRGLSPPHGVVGGERRAAPLWGGRSVIMAVHRWRVESLWTSVSARAPGSVNCRLRSSGLRLKPRLEGLRRSAQAPTQRLSSCLPRHLRLPQHILECLLDDDRRSLRSGAGLLICQSRLRNERSPAGDQLCLAMAARMEHSMCYGESRHARLALDAACRGTECLCYQSWGELL